MPVFERHRRSCRADHDLNDVLTFVNDVDTAYIVTHSSPVWSATSSGFGRLRRWRTCPRPQSFIGERGTIPFRPQRLTLPRGPSSTATPFGSGFARSEDA